MTFDVKDYWNSRLNKDFNLKGVGYITFSRFYNKWLYKTKVFFLNKIIRENGIGLKQKEVLDIGCGTGFFVEYYKHSGAKITGVDITEISVKQLTEKYPEFNFYCLDISAGKLDKKFDVVNMWDVIYHQVDEAAFEQSISNISKMCKPGTIFITTDTFGHNKVRQVSKHVVFRPIGSYTALMERLGFRLVKIYPLYRWMNRPYPWGTKITNIMAPFLYLLDIVNKRIDKNNISVAVWVFADNIQI